MAGRKRRSPNHEPGVPPEPEPTEPLPGPGIPLVQFRTMNGFSYWEVPLPEGSVETECLRIRRAL